MTAARPPVSLLSVCTAGSERFVTRVLPVPYPDLTENIQR